MTDGTELQKKELLTQLFVVRAVKIVGETVVKANTLRAAMSAAERILKDGEGCEGEQIRYELIFPGDSSPSSFDHRRISCGAAGIEENYYLSLDYAEEHPFITPQDRKKGGELFYIGPDRQVTEISAPQPEADRRRTEHVRLKTIAEIQDLSKLTAGLSFDDLRTYCHKRWECRDIDDQIFDVRTDKGDRRMRLPGAGTFSKEEIESNGLCENLYAGLMELAKIAETTPEKLREEILLAKKADWHCFSPKKHPSYLCDNITNLEENR